MRTKNFEIINFLEITEKEWDQILAVHLKGVMFGCQVFGKQMLEQGAGSIINIRSASAGPTLSKAFTYSVAKAGLAQLARIAALELAGDSIRVNTVHPNSVFDTGIWSEQVLASRAKHYGMSIEEYRSSNLLGVEVTSKDVASVVCALAGTEFSRTTGAQVPVDGGADRVI